MGRQWERQLLLPFSFYIDAKVLLFFELAKFNLECEPHGHRCGRIGRAGRAGRRVRQVGQVGQVGELFGYRSLILRSLFAHCSLIIRSSYIVLFVF